MSQAERARFGKILLPCGRLFALAQGLLGHRPCWVRGPLTSFPCFFVSNHGYHDIISLVRRFPVSPVSVFWF